MTRSMLLNTKIANEKADRQLKYMNKLAAHQQTEALVRKEVIEVIEQLPEKLAQARMKQRGTEDLFYEETSPRRGGAPLSPTSYRPSEKGSTMR